MWVCVCVCGCVHLISVLIPERHGFNFHIRQPRPKKTLTNFTSIVYQLFTKTGHFVRWQILLSLHGCPQKRHHLKIIIWTTSRSDTFAAKTTTTTKHTKLDFHSSIYNIILSISVCQLENQTEWRECIGISSVHCHDHPQVSAMATAILEMCAKVCNFTKCIVINNKQTGVLFSFTARRVQLEIQWCIHEYI